MKIYDKDMYNRQESIRAVLIVIVAFLLGFFSGYIVHPSENEKMKNEIKDEVVNEIKNEIINEIDM